MNSPRPPPHWCPLPIPNLPSPPLFTSSHPPPTGGYPCPQVQPKPSTLAQNAHLDRCRPLALCLQPRATSPLRHPRPSLRTHLSLRQTQGHLEPQASTTTHHHQRYQPSRTPPKLCSTDHPHGATRVPFQPTVAALLLTASGEWAANECNGVKYQQEVSVILQMCCTLIEQLF